MEFTLLFKPFSDSNLGFVKLHSWYYHTTDAIRKFGALNGMCTETYESLHKFYVKQPYRLSNKHNVTEQLIKSVCIVYFSFQNSLLQ
jgi:hypothetical protein